MNKKQIEEKVSDMAQKIVDEKGFSLWDVEYVREGKENYLRVFVDKEGGININEVVEVNKALDPLLDEEDFIDDEYILEVSSPGLTRPLKKPYDYVRCVGMAVTFKTYKPITVGKQSVKDFEGILKSYDEAEDVAVISFDDNEENDLKISRKDISKMNLAFVD